VADGLRQREPRVEERAFLAFLRGQRCCACSAPPRVEAAHLRGACPARGKRETGAGEKPSDRWAVPLCADCHRNGTYALHRVSEAWFFDNAGVDPFAAAVALHAEFLASGVSRIKRGVASGRKSEVSAKGFTSAKATGFPKRPSQVKRATDSAAQLRRPKRKWPSRPLRGRTQWPRRKMRGAR
jgi:hypothetical protein